jgi:hypothetical protein
MAKNPSVVNKIPCSVLVLALFVALLSLSAGIIRAEEAFRLGPVSDPGQIRLLPAQAWPPPEADQGDTLLKFYYLRGLVDALQYTQIDPETPARALEALKGLDLNQLAVQVDGYYLTHPENASLPPASVLLKVLSKAGKEK